MGDYKIYHISLVYAGKRFQQRWQSWSFQAGGGSSHVWGAFHGDVKSPLVLPDRYLTSELCRDILQSAFAPFARQHLGDNYRCQDDNATFHCTQVVCHFLQEGNVTKMEPTARSPGCNPIEHIRDELSRATTSMDNVPRNFGELCQTLLNKWAENLIERPQHLIASMPRRLWPLLLTWFNFNPSMDK